MNTPMLDKIDRGDSLDDTTQIKVALLELEERHNTTLRSARGLGIDLRCSPYGWVIYYEEGYSHPSYLLSRGERFSCPEDAIQALREKVDGWIKTVEAEERTEAHAGRVSVYTVGQQPCDSFQRADADIAALGPGNGRDCHQCPICEGRRAWCNNCYADHHEHGWESCKAKAYAETDDENRTERSEWIGASPIARVL